MLVNASSDVTAVGVACDGQKAVEQAGLVPESIHVTGVYLTVLNRDRGRAVGVGLVGSIAGQSGLASFGATGLLDILDQD